MPIANIYFRDTIYNIPTERRVIMEIRIKYSKELVEQCLETVE